ncbi:MULTISPECIES: acyltransferase family protein [Mycobacteriaceae]|uniref:Membrane acyltransferase n=4 Tax=Mycobacteriaceae TaxID=1762 RepID=F5YS38_MYCSD|nr:MULTISPECIES: acyltransferase [Mycobacteriaceae]AEF35998.1 membrane acyltransferase [Mycolicibacter sinensis]OQZ95787.1 acyltransferase [Mycolicibacter algericus DSM 45454]BBX14974.1 acyltransferase [Mycobacterium novum]GFG84984.1 acyltransferase [Mycolicibacter algericus]
MRSGEIKALTGLRIIAAVWVVLFHFRPLLRLGSPAFSDALAPVLDCGAQGVDLFFILSGFVLTWNYLERMGESFSPRATLHFLWLRLARVWPIYLVTLHLALLWVIFTLHVGHVPTEDLSRMTATSYVRQVLLMQLWFEPFFDGTSWNGPAWSISAEWLAYLLFGGLILVIYRVMRATSAGGLAALAVIASLPPLLLLLATGQFYTPWSWLPRIVMQFTAGALACASVRKLGPSDRARRGAGYCSVLLIVAIVGTLYYFDAHPISGLYDSGGLVDVLFVPLVMALAIGTGSLPVLLSTRVMVYGGQISFCLYMVHELVHTAWNWAAIQFEIVLDEGAGAAKWMVCGLLAGATLLSVFLFHAVEEPGRRWMRRMIGARPETAQVTPVEDPLAVDPVAAVAADERLRNGRTEAVPVSVH